MPGIAVAQMPGAEVEHPGEEGDEDGQATVACITAGRFFCYIGFE